MSPALDHRAIRFPSSGHIWIPRHGRRAAAAGLSMHSSCRPASLLAQRALYLGVRVLGPTIIPGRRAVWEPPLPESDWIALLARWEADIGVFDGLTLYHRPQPGRTGFAALLLRGGRGVAFARVHTDAARVRREFDALQRVHAAGPKTFRVAEPLTVDTSEGVGWMLTSSVPNRPLGAVRREVERDRVAAEVSEILSKSLPKPAGTPDHWVPAHGDFTPWNLRTDRRRSIIVIDWEDAGYAPPGTDRLYGALTAHATFGDPLPPQVPAEAARWIDAMLALRVNRAHDQGAGLDAQLREMLRRVPRK